MEVMGWVWRSVLSLLQKELRADGLAPPRLVLEAVHGQGVLVVP